MIRGDRLLAERLQTREQEELTDEEKAKLFMEFMEKRRKHFATIRAQEKTNRPPTKTKKRNKMSIYLKHIGGYKHNQLKGRSYDEIQKLFDKEMKRVNYFVAMNSEAQEINNEAELKMHIVTVKDDDIAIDVIPLATKPLVIVEYKLIREGIIGHYQLIRADESSNEYSSYDLGCFSGFAEKTCRLFGRTYKSDIWRKSSGDTMRTVFSCLIPMECTLYKTSKEIAWRTRILTKIIEKPTVETNEPKTARKENGRPQLCGLGSKSVMAWVPQEMNSPTIMCREIHNYEEIDGGFVSFGGNSKGEKITGKGVHRCVDKKNSILFTDTECVVLSPYIKLTEESHVLLKVSRKDNMYSVDLKNVIPQGGIENLIDLRVKVIRLRTMDMEFKNRVMNQFCEMKGIKREFSVARTPQQNGVAERKNRTLIEAARTMLADSKIANNFLG
ncbi:ribonuclease H-like domain-containing protein [Tanacetum coccineum]